MSKTSMILDVDTGVDDAFAVLFAALHPEINLLGITCVDGNTNVDQVVANTLKVLDAAGAGDIPVARGAVRPLLGVSQYAEYVHGADGMGDLGIAPSTRKVDPRSAVELLRDLIEGSKDPVTLVPVAPLTNIALFLRAFPETAKKIHRIVLMGGSASAGNATAAAEFNVWHDPEAAAIVFQSGVPITMYGLDVFMRPGITSEEALLLKTSSSPATQFAGSLVEAFIERLHVSPITLGDYGAVAMAIHPELFTTEMFDVVVDTSSGPARGQTICDRRDAFLKDLEPLGLEDSAKVRVVMDLDVEAVRQLWLKTIDKEWS
ncbi:MAG: nucleoside hydrolase [Streptomycetaceae bacterium]|nr:MAG: nucleoside hydrolase [Streptomycetaceae bacterium]